jgi:ArsR family transcriptional regulator
MVRNGRPVDSLAAVLRVMGDRTRMRVLLELRDRRQNVNSLAGLLDLPQPTVSRHLAILRMAGLVDSQRKGKEVHYALASNHGNAGLLRAILRFATAPSR